MTDICNVCLKTVKRSEMAILCDHCSSSVYEVIRAISSLFFFYEKFLNSQKYTTSKNQPTKQKQANTKQQRQQMFARTKLLRG